LWYAGALVLYWPALTIGLLSDDFVLAGRAGHFQLTAFNAVAFRPIPIALWGAVLGLGGGPWALHLVNVLLHGTNAFLITRFVQPVVRDRNAALVAGLVFLSLPIFPEAVAWSSGVFDVMATTFVLVTILVGRGYECGASAQRRVAFLALGTAALFCKETAVVTGPLVLLDAWMTGVRSRKRLLDAAGLLLLAAFVGLARVLLAPSSAMQPVTKYMLQRWIFGTFGSLAVPWHSEVSMAHPWLPMAGAAIVLVMLAFFFVRGGWTDHTRATVAAAVWMLLATLPAITLFFVAPDLQGARYLYLPGVGFAALVAVLIDAFLREAGPQAVPRLAALGAAGVLVALGAAGVRLHLSPWREAAATRDGVQLAAKADVRIALCEAPVFRSLPDTVRGAYVFRNGAVEALAGRSSPSGNSDESCAFAWTGERFVTTR
jgi:hypothetical protein